MKKYTFYKRRKHTYSIRLAYFELRGKQAVFTIHSKDIKKTPILDGVTGFVSRPRVGEIIFANDMRLVVVGKNTSVYPHTITCVAESCPDYDWSKFPKFYIKPEVLGVAHYSVDVP